MSHLGPVTGLILVLVNYMCFVIKFVSDKYISIIIKTKYVNSNNINDIYNKLNFIINYTYFTKTIKKTHTSYNGFDTGCDGMVL